VRFLPSITGQDQHRNGLKAMRNWWPANARRAS
jgi:hypothetical protein